MAGMDDYVPIADHGLIGDLHSVALVGTDGTIDWYCCPRFDSPSVFASILDARRGGGYRVAPADGGWTSKQLYFPDTNVLITRFLTPDGVGEVEDFMPIRQTIGGEHRQRLVHRALARDGAPLGADAQAIDLSADWRDCRRTHDIVARAGWWRAQLGLSLHLDPGLGLLTLRPAAPGLR